MNENINEFINQSVNIIIFIIALSLVFTIVHNTMALYDAIEYAYDDNVLYEGNIYEKSNVCSGAELIISITQGLEYDIKIDGRLIPKDIDYNTFDFDVIDSSANYSVKTIIDTKGQIRKVIYIKK